VISHIFREYDIRGIFPDELSEDTVFRLGRAFATYFRNIDIDLNRLLMQQGNFNFY